jgi:hypothetical protein
MGTLRAADGGGEASYVSTGHLPSPEQVQRWVDEAHQRYRSIAEGANSPVYPALERVPSELFGICVAGPAATSTPPGPPGTGSPS